MKIIDLTAPRREFTVRIDPSPAYDFLACLFLLGRYEPGLGFDVPGAWVAEARAALGEELLADFALFFPRFGPTMALVGVLGNTPALPVRAFLKRVAATRAGALVELMLSEALADRRSLPLLRAAIGGAEREQDAFLASTRPEIAPGSLRAIVALPPREAKVRLLRLLREGYSRVYAREEAAILPLLERDAESLARRATSLGGAQLVEYATGGHVIGAEATVSGVVLAPTYFFRPYNLVTAYDGVRVFIYPIEASPQEESPPPEMIRFYKALGDETRLRILRMLSAREMYLQELANALGVSHVTVLHHMAMLRAARLVRVVERENLKYYRLRAERADEAARLWLGFVLSGGGS